MTHTGNQVGEDRTTRMEREEWDGERYRRKNYFLILCWLYWDEAEGRV